METLVIHAVRRIWQVVTGTRPTSSPQAFVVHTSDTISEIYVLAASGATYLWRGTVQFSTEDWLKKKGRNMLTDCSLTNFVSRS